MGEHTEHQCNNERFFVVRMAQRMQCSALRQPVNLASGPLRQASSRKRQVVDASVARSDSYTVTHVQGTEVISL